MSDSFSDWTAKMAEAFCVLNGIHCKRRFTDVEIKRALEQVRAQTKYGADVIKVAQ